MKRHKYRKLAIALGLVIIVCAIVVWAMPNHAAAPTGSLSNAKPSNPTSQPAGFNKSQYSINTASSLWVVVNKGRVLPASYVPAGLTTPNVPLNQSASSPNMKLRSDAANALANLFAAAKQQGLSLMLTSGYRSYNEQQIVYQNYAGRDGVATADTYSARPGHSEHQTGLAADVEPASGNCVLDQCFGNTPEGKWLAANAYKFGFIIRYPKDGESLTGYEYEPWHIRYVGTPLATQIHKTGQTLEQFFGLPAITHYQNSNYQLKL